MIRQGYEEDEYEHLLEAEKNLVKGKNFRGGKQTTPVYCNYCYNKIDDCICYRHD